ncbi:MAG: aminodeoxychorismate/anthranilate synthase component II [Marinilabiliaceae bacterium]|jgi:anthranilate synthase component 2|nr:aminodeoxychorismate/anthranilate synthase component II [Marinilabiliaceae bacterium]
MEVLLIDNYDSFTFNIAHMFNEHRSVNLQIIASDRVEVAKISHFDGIIFSPGPDIPGKGNIMERVLESYKSTIPVLGICLGLQAITLYFGGKIERLDSVVHGRTREIKLTDTESGLFEGIEDGFKAGLYHSWIATREQLPDVLKVTAVSDEGRIMAIKHRHYNIEAVQFHPESIMTPCGPLIIKNWIENNLIPSSLNISESL